MKSKKSIKLELKKKKSRFKRRIGGGNTLPQDQINHVIDINYPEQEDANEMADNAQVSELLLMNSARYSEMYENEPKDSNFCIQYFKDGANTLPNLKLESNTFRIAEGELRNLTIDELARNRLIFSKNGCVVCTGNIMGGDAALLGGRIFPDVAYLYAAVYNPYLNKNKGGIEVYISDDTRYDEKVHHHSNILGNTTLNPVCSGYITFKDVGEVCLKILNITNNSGHYKPSIDNLKCFTYILYRQHTKSFVKEGEGEDSEKGRGRGKGRGKRRGRGAFVSEGARSHENNRRPMMANINVNTISNLVSDYL